MLIFEATFLTLAFANAFGYALVAARARSVVAQSARDPHLQPRRRYAAGRRRHRRGGGALRQLRPEASARVGSPGVLLALVTRRAAGFGNSYGDVCTLHRYFCEIRKNIGAAAFRPRNFC